MKNSETHESPDDYEKLMSQSSSSERPVDYFYLLTSKSLQATQERAKGLEHVIKHLDNNPVAHLSAKEFHDALRLVVSCANHANHQTRTATGMTMANWLNVLDGKMAVTAFRERYSTWDWKGLASLNFHPFIAACYSRVLRDALAAFEQLDSTTAA